ncbi:hypothetical protein EUX98_g511 [Antrodiella citrinella]|uniref:Alpha/beta hydrolase fold-3 domain-containing protein n=1 Tax=Antrodiella citrinella TaxID=2447956 RepID=A0A4V3XJL9_9APHY|nr:hypothetical protein EUX98_g511 [Antrodiella citrinella]
MASWYPFSGTEFSLKRYMLRQFIGTVLPSNTDKQLQWILPSTGTTYTRYQRSLSSKSAVVSESIGHGAWVHWIGPKTNKKVMYYIHGGGFLLPIFDGHLKMIDWWRTEASKHDVDFSVAVLEYTLANHAPWPTQLLQTSAGLAHLLQQGYDPADITIAGDSAGGHQVACLLSHIIHPHPDVAPVKLGRPLAGAAIMSGWLTFGITTSSWKRFGTEDAMAPLMALLRWSKLLIETKRSTGDDFYLEAALAPSDWWAGLGSATKNVLLTAGEREGMVDDIVNTKRKMENVSRYSDVYLEGQPDVITHPLEYYLHNPRHCCISTSRYISSMALSGTKQLQKLLVKEAKTDEKNLKRAQKEVSKAEKAFQKSIKDTQKAKKKTELTIKKAQKTAKSLLTAQQSHDDAVMKLDKADQATKEARDKEYQLEQEVSSYQDCLTDVHHSKILNDEARERKKAAAYIKLRQDQVGRGTEGVGPTSAIQTTNLSGADVSSTA